MSHVSISLENAKEICEVFDRLFETFSGTVSLKSVLEHEDYDLHESVFEVAKQIDKLCGALNDETNKTTDIKKLKEENNELKEQLDTLDQECASRMNKEQESEQDEIITKLCDMIRGLVPDPHADALIDEAYGENE